MSLLFAVFLSLSAPVDSFPYRLDQPSAAILFEAEALREVSGLSPTDVSGVFLAMNDEEGVFYFVDIKKGGTVVDKVSFREKGDFEGVEMVGQCLYAAKSNGTIFEVGCWQKNHPAIESYNTPLAKTDDVEGLCYDPSRKALLLACKGDPQTDTLRQIWAFDLQTKELGKKPVYSLDPKAVNRLVGYGPEEKPDFFSPSGIAIHPQTKDIYLISTALKRLVVLDPATGAIRYALHLDKKLLPQPEGISFDTEGNLYISSEGKKEAGRLLRFDQIRGQ